MRNPLPLGALAFALLLAACSSIPIGPASKLRGLDLVNDDIASLLLAFDLPLSLEPVAGDSVLGIVVTGPAGERRIAATLIPADPGDLAGTLPPPAESRSYYLFGFSDADKARVREAQAWARTLPAGAGTLAISLTPGLCSTEALDPSRTTLSALVALPGASGLAPLLSNVPVGAAMAVTEVPACAGHSG